MAKYTGECGNIWSSCSGNYTVL